ncbi:MAG: hypothetical protein BGO77_05950 [Caedibacter sp. 37-49]|nr:MAG: hypothetical protein BGO77_05950 [Caedibacter sp. 37-49]
MNQYFVYFIHIVFILSLCFPAYPSDSDSDMDISYEEIQLFGAPLSSHAPMDIVNEELSNSENFSSPYDDDIISPSTEIYQLYLQKRQDLEEQDFPNSPEIIDLLEDITRSKEASPSVKTRAYYHLGLIDFSKIREWNDSFCVSAYDAFDSAVLEKGDLQTTIKCLYYLGKMDLNGWGNENGPDPDKARERFYIINAMSMENRSLPYPYPMDANLWCLSWYEIIMLFWKNEKYEQAQDTLGSLEWTIQKYATDILPDVRALSLYARGLMELRSEEYGNARFTFSLISRLEGISSDVYAYALCQLAEMDLEGYGLCRGANLEEAYKKLQTVAKMPSVCVSMRAHALFSLAKIEANGYGFSRPKFGKVRAYLDEIQALNRVEKVDETILGLDLCLTAWMDYEGKGLNEGIPDHTSAYNLLAEVTHLETASLDVKNYASNLIEILNEVQPDLSGMQDFLFKVNPLGNVGLVVEVAGSDLFNAQELWGTKVVP